MPGRDDTFNTAAYAARIGLTAAYGTALGDDPYSQGILELAATEGEETLALLDEALTVHEALAAAPEHCREILDRFFAQDESYKTIGEALDLPSGTIASRISRCLARLRAHMEGRNNPLAPSGDR